MTVPTDRTDCEPILEQLPDLALGALERGETEAVLRHVRACSPCRRELASFDQVADALLVSPQPTSPPASLRSRVLESAGIAASSSQRRVVAVSRWRRFLAAFSPGPSLVRFSPAILALALLLAAGVGYQTVQLQGDLQRARLENTALRTEMASSQATFSDVLSPGTIAWGLNGTDAASSATATLYCRPASRTGLLAAANLPVLPEGQAYQLWLIHDGQRASGGLLTVDSSGRGVLTVQAPEPFSAYQSVGMTIEPAAGSAGPTGQRVLSGSLTGSPSVPSYY